jgi:transcriptional regulator with XRE-family HTH domain
MRRALGMTYERFAEELDVAVRTVAYWQSRPDSRIRDPGPLERLYCKLDSEERLLMRSLMEYQPSRESRDSRRD